MEAEVPANCQAPVTSISPAPAHTLRKASLYVGDLHPEVTERELAQAFCGIGPLASLRVCKDRLSNKSLCYAYVNFIRSSDAAKALACLNHTKLRGKSMRIMWCERDPHRRKTNVANLYVKNLDPSITSARLEGLFSKFGAVLSCKVAEENGKSKGFGFVQFDLAESALDARNALHGSMLEGRELYVSNFLKKSERNGAFKEPRFTNLYVKNLDESLTENLLRNKFSEYGNICSVVIMKDEQGKSKGFGFVDFQSHEEAKKAMESLNGSLFGSKNMYVGKAQTKSEREDFLKREYEEFLDHQTKKPKALNLYVKNLDLSIDDRKLGEHFSAFGQVISAKVRRHDNGISKGFGFVRFSTEAEAKGALDMLNGTVLQGKHLFVAVAQNREERQRQLESYHAQYTPQPSYRPNNSIFAPRYYPLFGNPWPYLLPIPLSHPNAVQQPLYQYYGGNMNAPCPSGVPNSLRKLSAYSSLRQSQHGTTMDSVFQQHPVGYATSSVPMQGQKHRAHKDQKVVKKMWYKKNRTTGVSIEGSALNKGLNKSAKQVLCPHIDNFQRGHAEKINGILLERSISDMQKLLKSPEALAFQVGKATQMLKKVNSQT